MIGNPPEMAAPALAACCLLALSALAAGCARQPDASVSGKRGPAPDHHRPSIPMTELQKRILSYAGSLRSPGDISPERFEAAMGLSLVPDESVSIRRVAKDLVTTEGYNYGASYFSVESAGGFPSHEVIFYQKGKPPVTDVPAGVCYWHADRAGRALERLGYRTGGEAPFQRGGLRQYWRPIHGGKQGMDTSLLTYRSDEGDSARTCVYAVQFGGGDK